MTSQLPHSELLARGEMVGEYRIIGRHASGGMGVVYEATHPLIGKRVAIKIIHGRLSRNLQAVQRFIDEARAVNHIGHPNLVDIFAFGTLADGRCYFVMEWLEGESLFERMTHGYLGVKQILDVLAQLTDALTAAHAAGVVHRDLKPANVHLVKRGQAEVVKLLDFGIAKLGENELGTGVAMGTPEFVSPEQAQGATVDAATDIYSLGALAYALFIGRLPFMGGDPRVVLDLQIHQPVPEPQSFWPRVPPALARLLTSMLAKRKERRPTLAKVREEIAAFEHARLLNETVPHAKLSRSNRSVLVRNFDRFGALARALMEDLSAGIAWVSPVGEAPAVGSPILIRFRVEDYGVAVDFPGLIDRHFGPRSSIRYDRVAKEDLGRILSVMSGLGDAEPGGAELDARWLASAPTERWTSEVPPDWRRRSKPAEEPPELERVTEIIPNRTDGRVPEPLEPQNADTVAPASAPARGAGGRRPSAFGLTMKVLLLIAAVTVTSVLAVMWLALENAFADREYYFEELALRTSLYLTETLRARSVGWQAELTSVLAGALAKGDLGVVVHCSARSCEALRGELPELPLAHRATDGFAMEKAGDALLVSLVDGGATAYGVVPEARLVDARTLPSYLSAWVIDANGEVIAAVGPKKSSRAAVHQARRESGGSKQLRAEDGEEMIGAWPGPGPVRVVVAVPKSVVDRAVEQLSYRVTVATIGVLAAAALFALLFARRVTRRLRTLTAQTAQIGRGEFTGLSEADAGDEVGQLARSFQEMADALRARDEEVREIQRRMSRAELRAVQRQLAQSLESQLAPALESIRSVLEPELQQEAPREDFHARQVRLRHLHARAASAVQRALALTSIVGRRVDFASAVSEAISFVKEKLGDRAPVVKLFAANAVLFPRLDVGESELREITVTLLERWVQGCGHVGSIEVRLSQRGPELLLAIKYPPAQGGRTVVAAALSEITPLVLDASASAALREEHGVTSVVLAFAVELEAEEPA